MKFPSLLSRQQRKFASDHGFFLLSFFFFYFIFVFLFLNSERGFPPFNFIFHFLVVVLKSDRESNNQTET